SGLFLPKEPVSKGTTWEQKLETKSGFGKMRVDNVNTYQGTVKRDSGQLEQVAMKPKVAIESDNPKFTIKAQDAKGVAYFDNAAGRIVETNMTQTMEIEASLGGQTYNQKVKQTASMKLVK